MSNKNKIIRLELIKIYGKICMLGEPLTKENYITLHHIIPQRIKKITTIENGALLSLFMHQDFNFIENWYYGEYDYINEYLRYYKETRDDEERKRMNAYVKKLARENNKARTKKEFECKIEYLIKNSCSRCPKNRECEESDKDEQRKKVRK